MTLCDVLAQNMVGVGRPDASQVSLKRSPLTPLLGSGGVFVKVGGTEGERDKINGGKLSSNLPHYSLLSLLLYLSQAHNSLVTMTFIVSSNTLTVPNSALHKYSASSLKLILFFMRVSLLSTWNSGPLFSCLLPRNH